MENLLNSIIYKAACIEMNYVCCMATYSITRKLCFSTMNSLWVTCSSTQVFNVNLLEIRTIVFIFIDDCFKQHHICKTSHVQRYTSVVIWYREVIENCLGFRYVLYKQFIYSCKQIPVHWLTTWRVKC